MNIPNQLDRLLLHLKPKATEIEMDEWWSEFKQIEFALVDVGRQTESDKANLRLLRTTLSAFMEEVRANVPSPNRGAVGSAIQAVKRATKNVSLFVRQ